MNEYVSGYLQKDMNGTYQGSLRIDGVDISPIEGQYFKEDGETYLWIKRRPVLEYDMEEKRYKTRQREPRWECYMKKQKTPDVVAYKGTFAFLHFRYSITGVWDKVFGTERNRLNFYVERLPRTDQTIINNINERRRKKE